MKKTMFLLLTGFIAIACPVTPVPAQTHQATVQSAKHAKDDFAAGARKLAKEIDALLPADPENGHEFTTYQFGIILLEARGLTEKVQKAGARMTDAQYNAFQRELRKIEARLDQMQAGNTTASGPSQSECFSSCDRQYQGWAGSNGWERFRCKINCFRINVYVNS